MGYIYVIKNNINSKLYIGQTKHNVNKRFSEHKICAGYRPQILYQAMRKYGIENFYIEILEEIPNQLLDKKEIFWIQKMNSITPNGYNMTKGGDFNPMSMPEQQARQRKVFMENNPTKNPEVRRKISEANKGRKHTDEEKRKMRLHNNHFWKGKKLPESIIRRGMKHPMFNRKGKDNPCSKDIMMFSKNNEFIRLFHGIYEAVEFIKDTKHIKTAQESNISKAATGVQKTAYGYIWKYPNKV